MNLMSVFSCKTSCNHLFTICSYIHISIYSGFSFSSIKFDGAFQFLNHGIFTSFQKCFIVSSLDFSFS